MDVVDRHMVGARQGMRDVYERAGRDVERGVKEMEEISVQYTDALRKPKDDEMVKELEAALGMCEE